MRFLGKKHGFYPEDATQAYWVDSLLDALADFGAKGSTFAFEQDPEVKKAKALDFTKNYAPTWFAAIDKRLANATNKHHFVGDSLTIADICFSMLTLSVIYNELHAGYPHVKDEFDKFENLKHYAEHAQHTFAEYLAQRPKKPF